MSVPNQRLKMQSLVRKRKRKLQARLRRKERQRSFFGEGMPAESLGDVKMSELLPELVEPFADLAADAQSYQRLLMLGTLAWNAALLPPAEQQEMVDETIREGLGSQGEELRAGCREIVNQLILRKQRYFSQYRRPIVDFRLEDRGNRYYLSVASAIM